MSDQDPVAACLHGQITAEVAVARMLLAGDNADAIARRVQAQQIPGKAWSALNRLVALRIEALGRLRRMIDEAEVDHARAATTAQIAALFDRAVATSPEASVALYSLGDPVALAAATEEILSWLRGQLLFATGMDVLDLGCGIGRLAAALAPHAGSVLGLDVSAEMIREARRRCGEIANVRFAVTAGQDLGSLADKSFDLLLAVDSFPYLMQAGVAERHVADARRVLRRDGSLVILNLSYRGDPQADKEEAQAWAARHDLTVGLCGLLPFRLWDGAAFVLVRLS
jgi:cyclopropane fatty-acyl-phospholipid synthase-like methyltransferase